MIRQAFLQFLTGEYLDFHRYTIRIFIVIFVLLNLLFLHLSTTYCSDTSSGLAQLGTLGEDHWNPWQVRQNRVVQPRQNPVHEDSESNDDDIDWLNHYNEALRLARYAHTRGDATATVALGLAMYKGLNTQVNTTRAAAYFHSVANKHADASFYIGEMLMGKSYGDIRESHDVVRYLAALRETRRTKTQNPLPPFNMGHNSNGANVASSYSYSNSNFDPRQIDEYTSVNVKDMDPMAAIAAYASAAHRGHTVALHRLAHMMSRGIGEPVNCEGALSSFKIVAERGDWGGHLTRASNIMKKGYSKRVAVGIYASLANLGIDAAQANAASLLSSDISLTWTTYVALNNTPEIIDVNGSRAMLGALPEPRLWISQGVGGPGNNRSVLLRHMHASLEENQDPTSADVLFDAEEEDTVIKYFERIQIACERRALHLYIACADQGHGDAHIKVGDFHYYGLAGLTIDQKEAAIHYQKAADLRHPHAIFNLGLMYETGTGVKQDFHLAKRFYDKAAEFDTEAKLPRNLALFVLKSHNLLQSFLGRTSMDYIVNHFLFPLIQCFTHLSDFSKKLSYNVKLFKRKLWNIEDNSLDSMNTNSDSNFTVETLDHNKEGNLLLKVANLINYFRVSVQKLWITLTHRKVQKNSNNGMENLNGIVGWRWMKDISFDMNKHQTWLEDWRVIYGLIFVLIVCYLLWVRRWQTNNTIYNHNHEGR
jgi:TPR repeat protein